MNDRPLFSICVAVFNLEKYIGQCLDSILGQSFRDFEIWLIDNGSTDNSIAICEEYARKDNRIKYVKLPLPTLIGRPYMYACNHYRGEYFMSVDGDDYLVDGALQNIYDEIKYSNAELIMGTFVCDVEDGMNNFKDAEFDASKINGVPYEQVLEYLKVLPNFHTFQWRFIIRKSLMERIKRFNSLDVTDDDLKNRYNDGYTVLNFLLNTESIWYVSSPFYVYRQRQNSLSAPMSVGIHALEFMKNFLRIIEKSVEVLEHGDIYKCEYIYSLAKIRFEMFRELLFEMNNLQLSTTIQLLEKYKYLLAIVKKMSIRYEEFYEYIEKNEDISVAFNMYKNAEEKRIINNLNQCEGKTVYVFPTGMCGESLGRFMKKNGVNIKAFLDNDILKEGKKFEGTECRLPSVLEREADINNCCVFIATAYEKNIEAMKNQIMNYGVLEENIVIR